MALIETNRPWPSRLLGSLAVQTAGLMLICLVASQWLSIWMFSDERARNLRAASVEMAARELSLIVSARDEKTGRAGLTLWETAERPRRLSDVPGDPDPRPGPRPLADMLNSDFELDWRPEGHGVAAAEIGYNWSVLSIPLAGGYVNALLAQPDWTNPWKIQTRSALALTSLGLLLATLLISRRVTAPMRALAEAADQFRGGGVTLVNESGLEEVGRTLAAFNAMQERLTRLLSERTRMLSALGHDLRTPMTRLRLRAHLIEDAELREPVLRDLGEIEALTERALELARGISATGPGSPVDLPAFARDLVEDLGDAGISITLGSVSDAPFRGHADALRRAVTNLAENGHRYAKNTVLEIEDEDELWIKISDRGPGLPEDRLEEIVQPFARLEASRAKETGGAGLGLSLADAVAQAHGGRLDLRNRPGGGLQASLVLPLSTG